MRRSARDRGDLRRDGGSRGDLPRVPVIAPEGWLLQPSLIGHDPKHHLLDHRAVADEGPTSL